MPWEHVEHSTVFFLKNHPTANEVLCFGTFWEFIFQNVCVPVQIWHIFHSVPGSCSNDHWAALLSLWRFYIIHYIMETFCSCYRFVKCPNTVRITVSDDCFYTEFVISWPQALMFPSTAAITSTTHAACVFTFPSRWSKKPHDLVPHNDFLKESWAQATQANQSGKSIYW